MSDLIVSVEQGEVRGTIGKDYYGGTIYKFFGIPYAKAPIGDLRLKSPEPPEKWNGVRDGTKEGPECPSADMYFTYYIGNEDNCLNLNIYTKEIPKDAISTKKPVMVWIHGGGFTFGSNKSHSFGPEYLLTQGIVLVAINYRLGILGFASFEDESLEVPGNAGLKDMRQALKWIQKNIGQFGGDPDNVTIFGESAGSAACHYLCLSPTTKGLFHKAILQSGAAFSNWSWGKRNSADIAKCLGYKETDEKSIFQKLKQESAKNIVRGQKKLPESFLPRSTRPFGPVIEKPSVKDAFLTESPHQIMKEGRSHHIPMIIGYNSREGIFFELVRRTVPGIPLPKNFEDEIPYEFGLEVGSEKSKEVANSIQNFYYGNEEATEENVEKTYMMKGDSNFIYGIQKNIQDQSKNSPQPVYAYVMTLDGPFNYFKHFCLVNYFKTIILFNFIAKVAPDVSSFKTALKKYIQKFSRRKTHGVAHADDLFYIFPTFFTPPVIKDTKEDRYIQRFVQMWSNFAKTGNPTPQTNDVLSNIEWEPYKTGEKVLEIGNDLKMISNTDWERVQFWDKLFKTYYQ